MNLPTPTFRIEFPTHIDRTVTIGRHPASSLVLPDMHISSKHLTLRQITSNGFRKIFIEDTSSNGTWVNGERIAKAVPIELKHGDELSFPCEEANRQEYSFVFKIIGSNVASSPLSTLTSTMTTSPNQVSADDATGAISTITTSPGLLPDFVDNQILEEWKLLQDQCDSISREASRVAATVYESSENIQELLALTRRGILLTTSKRSSLSSIGSSNSLSGAGTASNPLGSQSSNKQVRITPGMLNESEEANETAADNNAFDIRQESSFNLEAAKEMLQAIKNIEMILESSSNTSLASSSLSSSTSESSTASNTAADTVIISPIHQKQQKGKKNDDMAAQQLEILEAIRQAISKRSEWENALNEKS